MPRLLSAAALSIAAVMLPQTAQAQVGVEQKPTSFPIMRCNQESHVFQGTTPVRAVDSDVWRDESGAFVICGNVAASLQKNLAIAMQGPAQPEKGILFDILTATKGAQGVCTARTTFIAETYNGLPVVTSFNEYSFLPKSVQASSDDASPGTAPVRSRRDMPAAANDCMPVLNDAVLSAGTILAGQLDLGAIGPAPVQPVPRRSLPVPKPDSL